MIPVLSNNMHAVEERTRSYTWSAIFVAILFITVSVVVIRLMPNTQALMSLGALDYLVMAFATQRLIRLLTFDKVLQFVRDIFLDIDPQTGERTKPRWGFRREIAELNECVWCTGMWFAVFVPIAYLYSPETRLLVIMLAVASLATIIQVIVRRYVQGN